MRPFRGLRVLLFCIYLAVVEGGHYETLGLKKTATDKDIKKAYRSLALKWHPDKHANDQDTATKKFQEISEAYEVLSDKDARRRYDQVGDTGFGPGGPSGPSGPGGPSSGPGRGGAHFSGFQHKKPEEIFKEFFGTDNPFDKMFGLGAFDEGDSRPFANMHTAFGSGAGGPDPTMGKKQRAGPNNPMEDILGSMFGGGGSPFGSGGPGPQKGAKQRAGTGNPMKDIMGSMFGGGGNPFAQIPKGFSGNAGEPEVVKGAKRQQGAARQQKQRAGDGRIAKQSAKATKSGAGTGGKSRKGPSKARDNPAPKRKREKRRTEL